MTTYALKLAATVLVLTTATACSPSRHGNNVSTVAAENATDTYDANAMMAGNDAMTAGNDADAQGGHNNNIASEMNEGDATNMDNGAAPPPQ